MSVAHREVLPIVSVAHRECCPSRSGACRHVIDNGLDGSYSSRLSNKLERVLSIRFGNRIGNRSDSELGKLGSVMGLVACAVY